MASAADEEAAAITVRRAVPADARPAARMIDASFSRFVAPSLDVATRVAIRLFMTERALRERLEKGAVAWCVLVPGGEGEAAAMAGYAELRGRRDELGQGKDHLSLLFTAVDRQGQGMARRLMAAVDRHLLAASPPIRTLSVNASAFAVPAYERLGFRLVAMADDGPGTPSSASLPMRRRLGRSSPSGED